ARTEAASEMRRACGFGDKGASARSVLRAACSSSRPPSAPHEKRALGRLSPPKSSRTFLVISARTPARFTGNAKKWPYAAPSNQGDRGGRSASHAPAPFCQGV